MFKIAKILNSMGIYTRPVIVVFLTFIISILFFLAQLEVLFLFLNMVLPVEITLDYFISFKFPEMLLVILKVFIIIFGLFIAFSLSYFLMVRLITSAANRARKKVKIGTYRTNNIYYDAAYKEYLRANIYTEIVDRLILIFPYLRVYILRKLGCKIGKNVTLGGTIREPYLIEIDDGAVIGYHSIITAHAQNRGEFVLGPIKIGKNAIIGAGAVVFPHVEIGEGAVVGANAVVVSNTKIPPNTLYAGVPAREIKRYPELVIERPEIIDMETWLQEKESKKTQTSGESKK